MFQIKWSYHQIVLTNCSNISVNKGVLFKDFSIEGVFFLGFCCGSSKTYDCCNCCNYSCASVCRDAGIRDHEDQMIRLLNTFNLFLNSSRLHSQYFMSIDQITKKFSINCLTFSVKEEALLVDMDVEDQMIRLTYSFNWFLKSFKSNNQFLYQLIRSPNIS